MRTQKVFGYNCKYTIPILLCILFSGSIGTRVFSQTSSWDTARMKNVCNLAGASIDLKPATTDSLARLLFGAAKNAGNADYISKAASLISISAVKMNKPSFRAWYDTAMRYFSQLGNNKWIAYTNLQMGYSLGEKFQFEAATRYLIKAVDTYAALKDSAMLITGYTALSNMFQGFGDYNNEKKYALKAVALVEKIHDQNADRRWGAYAVLGISYDDNQEYDKALDIHVKNIENASNDWVLFLSYNNVGVVLRKKKMYKDAEKYFTKALSYANKINDNNSYATVYDNLGRAAIQSGNYIKAKKYLDLALSYAHKNHVPQKLLDVYETGWLLGKATGNSAAALDFLTLRTAIKDSLLNAEKSRAVYDLQIKYESDEKEKENQRLHYVNELQSIEQQKARSDKRKLIIGGCLAFALITMLFVLMYRNKSIKNKLVEEQVFVKAIMEGEQNERIRIARDLHDSIGQMLSVTKMNLSTLHYQLPDNKIAGTSVELLDNAVAELRNISHNLMPEDLNFGLFTAIENICEKISASGKTLVVLNAPAEVRKHSFEKSNMLTIYRIVQEVLNNMVKHAQASKISIAITLAGAGRISISIADDGQGFDATEIERSQGLGWKNIMVRARMLDGKMQISSEPKKGTQIDIAIPVA